MGGLAFSLQLYGSFDIHLDIFESMQIGGEFRFSQFDRRREIAVPTFYCNSPTVGQNTLSIRMSTCEDLSPFLTVSEDLIASLGGYFNKLSFEVSLYYVTGFRIQCHSQFTKAAA